MLSSQGLDHGGCRPQALASSKSNTAAYFQDDSRCFMTCSSVHSRKDAEMLGVRPTRVAAADKRAESLMLIYVETNWESETICLGQLLRLLIKNS